MSGQSAVVGESRASIGCETTLECMALKTLPIVEAGDDLLKLVGDAIEEEGICLRRCDVLVLASKLLSRVEDRFIELGGVTPSERAEAVAKEVGKDSRLVEVRLEESSEVSRKARGVLIVRHRLGHVCANAGVDASNVGREEGGRWVLLLPENPDRWAREIRAFLYQRFGVEVGVVISDSLGRPFRLGTLGQAIGVSGVPALWGQQGETDLFQRPLETTETALADQIAVVADLMLGQGAEGRGAVVVRGVTFPMMESSAAELLRERSRDLYA